DSLGKPIDGKGPIQCSEERPVFALPPTPMEREMIEHPLPTGVKVIDGMITLGQGQRMGIFAPAGVGKSTLMGMLARGTQRDIGLAAGEPPARRGYPPSVFAEIPRLLERAGMGARGSITALYTVLAEDESGNDPIAEEVRGILDGHMILSRKIAARNQYPAIDVLGSLSRVMSQIVPKPHRLANGRLRQLMAKYDEMEALIQMGEYRPGGD